MASEVSGWPPLVLVIAQRNEGNFRAAALLKQGLFQPQVVPPPSKQALQEQRNMTLQEVEDLFPAAKAQLAQMIQHHFSESRYSTSEIEKIIPYFEHSLKRLLLSSLERFESSEERSRFLEPRVESMAKMAGFLIAGDRLRQKMDHYWRPFLERHAFDLGQVFGDPAFEKTISLLLEFQISLAAVQEWDEFCGLEIEAWRRSGEHSPLLLEQERILRKEHRSLIQKGKEAILKLADLRAGLKERAAKEQEDVAAHTLPDLTDCGPHAFPVKKGIACVVLFDESVPTAHRRVVLHKLKKRDWSHVAEGDKQSFSVVGSRLQDDAQGAIRCFMVRDLTGRTHQGHFTRERLVYDPKKQEITYQEKESLSHHFGIRKEDRQFTAKIDATLLGAHLCQTCSDVLGGLLDGLSNNASFLIGAWHAFEKSDRAQFTDREHPLFKAESFMTDFSRKSEFLALTAAGTKGFKGACKKPKVARQTKEMGSALYAYGQIITKISELSKSVREFLSFCETNRGFKKHFLWFFEQYKGCADSLEQLVGDCSQTMKNVSRLGRVFSVMKFQMRGLIDALLCPAVRNKALEQLKDSQLTPAQYNQFFPLFFVDQKMIRWFQDGVLPLLGCTASLEEEAILYSKTLRAADELQFVGAQALEHAGKMKVYFPNG